MLDELNVEREYLFSIAYRMLGSVTDAEDMVQEALLRAERASPRDLRSPRAYLARVITRLCIDHLRSARVRRESYVGPWLPEPLIGEPAPDPAEATLLSESLSMAFLVLLESLNPVERAVYLLREVFQYDYPEIAEVVERSEANCRQIAHRAREYVAARRPRFEASREKQAELLRQFAAACVRGDLAGLTSLFHEEIVLWSDGGGKAVAALNPIHGPDKVGRFIHGVLQKFGTGGSYEPLWVNGQPGFVTYRNGELHSVTLLDIRDGTIAGIRLVRNPDKLTHVPPSAEFTTETQRHCG